MTTEHHDLLKTIVDRQPYPVIFAALSGAHLYGFPSLDSDYDVRGAHCLPLTDVLGLHGTRDTVEESDLSDGIELDLVTHDIKTFALLAMKKNGNLVEQVVSPHIIHTTPAHEALRPIVLGCITKYIAFHYLGFSAKKWKEFEKNEHKGIKVLLYVYRVLLTGIHLMNTGEVEPNLVHLNDHFKLPYIPDLIAAKKSLGEHAILETVDVDLHHREFERLTAELEAAKDTTHLPENPAREDDLNTWLIETRMAFASDA